MSPPPDRPNNSPRPSYSGGEVPQWLKDFAYGIWLPSCGIAAVISALSAPHAIGLIPIKVFLLFGLSAIALVGLFLNVQRGLSTWHAKLNHVAFLSLIVHMLYFTFIHGAVTK